MVKTREDVRALLDELSARVQNPRALEIGAVQHAAFEAALERATSQLVEELPPVLVVAIAGGTGVGKSTLINGLAGASIAEAGAERPTTTQIVVYHHREVPLGGLPSEVVYGARFVAHEREELRYKVLVDTPDLDSFVRDHRERTLALLKSAGLVLYVFSPEKYLEERIWSVLRNERRFSASAAVLNKADTLAPDELEGVAQDLAERLAGAGLGSIRVFKTQAQRHAGGTAGQTARSDVDDLPALRTFLERELLEGDATRIVRENRRRTLAALRAGVEALAPREAASKLDDLTARVATRAETAGARLVEIVAPELAAVETELAPLATLRQHERFRGPFRAWLAVTDFLTIGLAGIVDRLVGRPARGTADVVERIFSQARSREVEGLLRDEERQLQDVLFACDLPVGRWREVAEEVSGGELLARLSGAVRERFEARSAVTVGRGGGLVWTVSAIGGLVPAAAIFGGLWLLVRDLFAGNYLGLGLFLHLFALVLFFFLALHAIVAVLLPTSGRLGKGLGLAAANEVLPALFTEWVERYRADVDADVGELETSLAALEELIAPEIGDLDRSGVTVDGGTASLAWPDPDTDEPPTDARIGESSGASSRPRSPEVDPAEQLLRALERE